MVVADDVDIDFGDPALIKLKNLLGEEAAAKMVRAIFVELGIHALGGPNDLLRFGAALVKRGGLMEAVGRSIRVRALLHGATEPERTLTGR